MTVTMDEHDLRRFADACVTAQREIALELAAPSVEQDWNRAPWEFKWRLVIERALGKALL